MECPTCGQEVGELVRDLIEVHIPERDKPEIKYNEVVKMYEQMRPIDPQHPMNDEFHTFVPISAFDCVDGT